MKIPAVCGKRAALGLKSLKFVFFPHADICFEFQQMHFHQVYMHKRDWLQPRGRLFVEACGCLGVPDKVVPEVEIAGG